MRQRRNELQNNYLPVGYGFKFGKFQESLDDKTVIIQWYIKYKQLEEGDIAIALPNRQISHKTKYLPP